MVLFLKKSVGQIVKNFISLCANRFFFGSHQIPTRRIKCRKYVQNTLTHKPMNFFLRGSILPPSIRNSCLIQYRGIMVARFDNHMTPYSADKIQFSCVKTCDTYSKALCFKEFMDYWKWEGKGSENMHWSLKVHKRSTNLLLLA